MCLATLGPGATNLVTGVADANMDRAPLVAISGQAATTRMHKESHQALDLVNLFEPISKFSTQVVQPETIPEVVRKAFKQAETEKPGVSFIDFPEDVAQMNVEGKQPLRVQRPIQSVPPPQKIRQAADIISKAQVSAHHGGQRRDPRRGRPAIAGLRRAAAHSRGLDVHGQGSGAVFALRLAGGGGDAGATITWPAASTAPT